MSRSDAAACERDLPHSQPFRRCGTVAQGKYLRVEVILVDLLILKCENNQSQHAQREHNQKKQV